MESEDLFSDEILDWLQDYDDEISADIELLLARASDVYESSIDSAPQPGSSPPERCVPSTSSSQPAGLHLQKLMQKYTIQL